jgi:hypothetical protein
MTSRVLPAYHAHSELDVSGVTIYDLDEIPSMAEAIVTYPCVIPVFEFEPDEEFTTSSIDTDDVTWTAVFLMLVGPAGTEAGPEVLTVNGALAIENYLMAVSRDPGLRGNGTQDTLDQHAVVTTRASIQPLTSGNYWYTLEIRHRWLFLNDDL